MMNGTHQIYSEVNNFMQNSNCIRQKYDMNNDGLKSCTNIKNICNELYFDRLPTEMVAKILSYLPVQDLIRVSGTTPAFEVEAQRVMNLLDARSKSAVIFQLVAKGDTSALCAIKKLGVDLGRIIDLETGNTLLHEAVNANIPGIINFILDLAGMDFNTKNLAGFTPLMIAVRKSNLPAVNTFINRHDIDINKSYDVKNNNEYSRGYGENDFVFNLLQENVTGSTALHFAVFTGSDDVMELFCKNEKADIELADHYGNTALMKAIFKKENRMVRLMLARKNMTLYQKNQGDGLLLHIALLAENIDILPDLLKTEPDVNRCDRQGNTALHLAVIKGSDKAVSLLLSSPGINISAPNRGEWTAQELALSLGYRKILNLLEEYGNRQHAALLPVEGGLRL